MQSDSHERHMRRALDVARNAAHRTSPNPIVGCVIVKDGQIIGEGVTQPAGQAHAEVIALKAAGRSARGADMYITLEPCCHVGRTGPCTQAIIDAGVARVFTGIIDPNPVVHGNGLRALESAGIETQNDVLGAECSAHHAHFSHFILTSRPWVILKAGVTLDGCIATLNGDSKWITGEDARQDAHRLRARCDAVLIGAETARLDHPRLTVRLVDGADPLRVVLDSSASLAPDSPVLGARAVLFHADDADPSRLEELRASGTEVVSVPVDGAGLDVSIVLDELAQRGVISLLVEGGGQVHGSFLEKRLADEACFYVAPKLIGQGRPVIATPSVASIGRGWTLDKVSITPMGDDVRVCGSIKYPDEQEG
jgi:diaminohydroxyphosphoribosylaminopyrimidine deaminase / 5-amino-6-(5-phosphoribosylamino)uracil reductase